MKEKHEYSAGGLVYRNVEGGRNELQFCIVNSLGGSAWQIPKGHIEKGESKEEAALREVREETGLTAEIEGELGESNYHFQRRKKNGGGIIIYKEVSFFLMRYVEGNVDDHDDEVLSAQWFIADEALAKLTFENEKELLKAAMKTLNA